MYDRLYVEFLRRFNVERDYYECHDLMEELWLEEGRKPLYQGLLQVAVGLYHHGNGNPGGAVKLLRQAAGKLAGYPPHSLGIDLGKLRTESLAYLERLEASLRPGAEPMKPRDLTIDILDPELRRRVERDSPDGGSGG
ncbi:DUF309 domain-containing protein [Paenibacillus thermoaerophilus]|uniref:DUF309 domain-containing protein n=1 Tax=Paenibacillus thermoaerophilus TaxID=1215385 RepID=A0ABW2VAQ6_9BACL|nr:DUF309 domain-containing protein [Paenibacillus thermoaerophilus]TMV17977.1 DUF309 domain-containing protein [Paenibacillus thermoaerophilus]